MQQVYTRQFGFFLLNSRPQFADKLQVCLQCFSIDAFDSALEAAGATGSTSVLGEDAEACSGLAGEAYDSYHVMATTTPEDGLQRVLYVFHSATAADQVVIAELETCTILDSAGEAESENS